MKSKRNKPYKPRPVNPIGGLGAIDRRNRIDELAQPMTDEQVANLGICYRIAYDCMVTGKASEENWATLVASLNVGLTLCEAGYGTEYQEDFNRALAGAFRAKLRAERCGAWGFDGQTQQDIKRALAIHDAQVEEAPKHALISAIRAVRDKVDRGDTYQEIAA